MQRLKGSNYPLTVFYQPLIAAEHGVIHDYRTMFHELDQDEFGPLAFAIETSADLSAPVEDLLGLSGHAEDDFHGWVRYGNLVSLLMVQVGIDITESTESIPDLNLNCLVNTLTSEKRIHIFSSDWEKR